MGQVAGLIPASLWQLGDLQGSLAAAQRALTLATALGDVGLQVSARLSLCIAIMWSLRMLTLIRAAAHPNLGS